MSREGAERAYGGKSADERRAERRIALLVAGRELWCEHGWAAVTMRGVCARARLTDRYFYESFSDRDALLVAVAEAVRDEMLSTILAAAAEHAEESLDRQLRAVVVAAVSTIEEDPGSVQIFFGEHGGSDDLEALRRETIGAVVQLFLEFGTPRLLPGVTPALFEVTLLVGIGGFVETMTAWRSGTLEATADELVEMLMDVAVRLSDGLIELDRHASGS